MNLLSIGFRKFFFANVLMHVTVYIPRQWYELIYAVFPKNNFLGV